MPDPKKDDKKDLQKSAKKAFDRLTVISIYMHAACMSILICGRQLQMPVPRSNGLFH